MSNKEESNQKVYEYYDIRKLEKELIGKPIWLQGRVHTIRTQGNMCFIVLRYQDHSLQAIAVKKVLGGAPIYKPLTKVSHESVINLYGALKESPVEIQFTSYKTIEFTVEKWEMVSPAAELPFQIDDASDFGETFRSDVGQALKFDYRYLDLRVPANAAILGVQSAVTNFFREYLLKKGFLEIHTPKLIGVASESGAEVFKLEYFDRIAYLAQSPQLYKQMAINADLDRVFEVGSVFRAEKCISTRHMTEFTGLDLEMTIPPDASYEWLMHEIWGLLQYIFDNLNKLSKNINIIQEKLPFQPPVYRDDPLIVHFKDAVNILIEAGMKQEPLEDLNRENELKLGELVKEKYGVDIFFLDEFPSAARPFYTMPHPTDPNYTNSYDIIFRGQEISSGAQRINDYGLLMQRVVEKGINPESLKHYLESFKYGSKPHGGCGFGLERIVSIYLDLGNVKKATFCPRDPKRLNP